MPSVTEQTLFSEMKVAYEHRRSTGDPVDVELSFIDNYMIPLAQKLRPRAGFWGMQETNLEAMPTWIVVNGAKGMST